MQVRRLDPENGLGNVLRDLQKGATQQATGPTGTIYVDQKIHTIDPNTGVETIFGQLPDGSVGLQQFIGDTTPPPVPSMPTATSALGTITIVWDGTLVNGAVLPPDYDHLNVYAQKAGSPSVLLAGSVVNAQDSIVYTNLTGGDKWTFWMTSVDKNGNESAASASTSQVTVASVLDDTGLAQQLANNQAQLDAANAAIAKKNSIYSGPTAPTGAMVVDDIWFNTSQGNKPYRWSGTAWVDTEDQAVIQALNTAISANNAAAAATAQAGAANSTAIAASAVAVSAQNTATSAQSAAASAQSVAVSANTTAANAQSVATSANNTAASANSTAAAANATATAANSTAASAQSIATSANNSAASAQSVATSANTTAANAQSVATSANNTAASAQSVATSANNTAVSANSTAVSANNIAVSANNVAASANALANTANSAANSAQISANGKNTITYSTNPASGSGATVGDIWFQTTSGVISAQWLWSGSGWVSQTLASSVIANLDAGKITAGYLSAARLQAGSITATALAAQSITATALAAGSITATALAAQSISATALAAQSITATALAAASITASALAAQSITATALAAQSITASALAAQSITATAIAAGSITASALAAQSITATALAAQSITASALAANAITASAIAGNTITADKLVIGDMTNFVVDPFMTGTGKIGGATYVSSSSTSVSAGAPFEKLAYLNGRDNLENPDQSRPATGGDQFYMEAWVRATTAATVPIYLGLWTKNQSGTNSWTTGPAVTVVAGQAGWVKATASLTAPANIGGFPVVSARAWIQIAGSVAADITGWYVTGWNVRRMDAGNLIVDGSINAAKIAAASITATALAAQSITATALAAGSITATALAAQSISATALAAQSITATALAAASITASALAAQSITATALAAQSITATALAAGSITASALAAQSITATALAAQSITATALAAQSITATAVASNSISATALQAGSVAASTLAVGSVTASAIAASTITGDRIAATTITATQIAASTITSNQIAASTIQAGNIAAGAIIADHISSGAIDGKLITGATVRTSASYPRTELNSGGLFSYDGSGKQYLSATSAGLSVTGSIYSSAGAGDKGGGSNMQVKIGQAGNYNSTGVHLLNSSDPLGVNDAPAGLIADAALGRGVIMKSRNMGDGYDARVSVGPSSDNMDGSIHLTANSSIAGTTASIEMQTPTLKANGYTLTEKLACTFTNGFGNQGAGQPLQTAMVGVGRVEMSGMINLPNNTVDVIVGYVATGHRPVTKVYLPVVANWNGTNSFYSAIITVETDGTIRLRPGGAGTGGYVAISGAWFIA